MVKPASSPDEGAVLLAKLAKYYDGDDDGGDDGGVDGNNDDLDLVPGGSGCSPCQACHDDGDDDGGDGDDGGDDGDGDDDGNSDDLDLVPGGRGCSPCQAPTGSCSSSSATTPAMISISIFVTTTAATS